MAALSYTRFGAQGGDLGAGCRDPLIGIAPSPNVLAAHTEEFGVQVAPLHGL
jgi:hypothetical protein